MPCPLCGDICRCSNNLDSAASPRWLADDDSRLASVMAGDEVQGQEAEEQSAPPIVADAEPGNGAELAPEDSPAWRQEVAARLNRYQSRRKPHPPRYPSLRLPFEQPDSSHSGNSASDDSSVFPPGVGVASHHALALDGFADSAAPATQTANVASAKIIEFPRSWTPPAAPLDELAEPVIDRPRILEAPETPPPPPALGGITIEPAHQPEMEKRRGIDIPLQSAPMSRRIFSAGIDAVIIASACALFGLICWKMTAIEPPLNQSVAFGAGLLGLFWAAYQYLLIVYSGSTPGLRLAKLELARFDGTLASRRLRRWRVLASFLSAVSLGMGYAWVFLDEDGLCWHDRITHTYLAPKSRQP